jgi:hypothetical protein
LRDAAHPDVVCCSFSALAHADWTLVHVTLRLEYSPHRPSSSVGSRFSKIGHESWPGDFALADLIGEDTYCWKLTESSDSCFTLQRGSALRADSGERSDAVFAPPLLIVIAAAPYYRRFPGTTQVKAFVHDVTAATVGAIAGTAGILRRRAVIDVNNSFHYASDVLRLSIERKKC